LRKQKIEIAPRSVYGPYARPPHVPRTVMVTGACHMI